MNLPGLVTVDAHDANTLDKLARMVGTCFLEEQWYATWLAADGIDGARKLAITQAIIRADYEVTAPFGCVYTLDDHAGAANVFLRSELGGTPWSVLEERAESIAETTLTSHEQSILYPRAQAMEAASDTNWPLVYAQPDDDLLYFISVGVDATRRGSGAFGRLFKPFLAYADKHNIRCYLDCYTDRLEQLYGHYGFEVVERRSAEGFDLVERCMVRKPRL